MATKKKKLGDAGAPWLHIVENILRENPDLQRHLLQICIDKMKHQGRSAPQVDLANELEVSARMIRKYKQGEKPTRLRGAVLDRAIRIAEAKGFELLKPHVQKTVSEGLEAFFSPLRSLPHKTLVKVRLLSNPHPSFKSFTSERWADPFVDVYYHDDRLITFTSFKPMIIPFYYDHIKGGQKVREELWHFDKLVGPFLEFKRFVVEKIFIPQYKDQELKGFVVYPPEKSTQIVCQEYDDFLIQSYGLLKEFFRWNRKAKKEWDQGQVTDTTWSELKSYLRYHTT